MVKNLEVEEDYTSANIIVARLRDSSKINARTESIDIEEHVVFNFNI